MVSIGVEAYVRFHPTINSKDNYFFDLFKNLNLDESE